MQPRKNGLLRKELNFTLANTQKYPQDHSGDDNRKQAQLYDKCSNAIFYDEGSQL